MGTYLILVGLLLAFASYGVIHFVPRVTNAPRPQSTKQIVSDGKGNHSRLAVPISVQKFRQLSELCDYSPEIVVGVVVSKSSREEANSMVLTDYDVAVLETLKGDRHKGR